MRLPSQPRGSSAVVEEAPSGLAEVIFAADADPVAVGPIGGSPNSLSGRSAEARRLLLQYSNVILFGPPGTGKTHAALAIRDNWRSVHGPDSVLLTTFHPSYSYEDFVEGFRPTEDDPGQFSLQSG